MNRATSISDIPDNYHLRHCPHPPYTAYHISTLKSNISPHKKRATYVALLVCELVQHLHVAYREQDFVILDILFCHVGDAVDRESGIVRHAGK